jgi:hypothetical protein
MQLLAGDTDREVLDDDRGSSFELHEFVRDEQTLWRVRWIPYLGPDKNPICNRRVRIAVDGRYQFESKPFSVNCDPRAPEAEATP